MSFMLTCCRPCQKLSSTSLPVDVRLRSVEARRSCKLWSQHPSRHLHLNHAYYKWRRPTCHNSSVDSQATVGAKDDPVYIYQA